MSTREIIKISNGKKKQSVEDKIHDTKDPQLEESNANHESMDRMANSKDERQSSSSKAFENKDSTLSRDGSKPKQMEEDVTSTPSNPSSCIKKKHTHTHRKDHMACYECNKGHYKNKWL